MKKMKIDLKTIIILILGGVLILGILFKGTGCDNGTIEIDDTQRVIDSLRNISTTIQHKNDSLKLATEYKDSIIIAKEGVIRKDSVALAKSNKKIKDLENRKNEISNTVNSMSDDVVIDGIADYIKANR